MTTTRRGHPTPDSVATSPTPATRTYQNQGRPPPSPTAAPTAAPTEPATWPAAPPPAGNAGGCNRNGPPTTATIRPAPTPAPSWTSGCTRITSSAGVTVPDESVLPLRVSRLANGRQSCARSWARARRGDGPVPNSAESGADHVLATANAPPLRASVEGHSPAVEDAAVRVYFPRFPDNLSACVLCVGLMAAAPSHAFGARRDGTISVELARCVSLTHESERP